MPRVNRVNELIRAELANALTKEIALENGFITISYVDCAPDLKSAKIGISVLPANFSGTALRRLRGCSGRLADILKKRTRLRRIPKFSWVIDPTESQAAEIEKTLEEIATAQN